MNTPRPIFRLLCTSFLAFGVSLANAQSADDPGAEVAAAPARFEAQGDGTVLDRNTNLSWAAKGKLGDISWAEAQSYCQSMGPSWSLPSTADLQSLYLPASADQEVCMGKLSCNITPLIEVMGLAYWSAESEATGSWYVYFADGKKYLVDANHREGKRALCVSRP